jgi:hypothetical protein
LATFNDSAIDTTLGTGTEQPKKQITGVTFDAGTVTSASLSFGHYVAKAYPILSVKDKNTSSDNTRLDLNIRKSNDDGNTVVISGFVGNPSEISTDGLSGDTKWIVAE